MTKCLYLQNFDLDLLENNRKIFITYMNAEVDTFPVYESQITANNTNFTIVYANNKEENFHSFDVDIDHFWHHVKAQSTGNRIAILIDDLDTLEVSLEQSSEVLEKCHAVLNELKVFDVRLYHSCMSYFIFNHVLLAVLLSCLASNVGWGLRPGQRGWGGHSRRKRWGQLVSGGAKPQLGAQRTAARGGRQRVVRGGGLVDTGLASPADSDGEMHVQVIQ